MAMTVEQIKGSLNRIRLASGPSASASTQKQRRPRKKSNLEKRALQHILKAGVGEPTREYIFHPKRSWRFDFAFIKAKVAIECEGGIYTKGRHTRASGFNADTEKYNEAAIMGWRVLRYTTNNIRKIKDDLQRIMR